MLKNCRFDAFKIHSQPFQAKTNSWIINFDAPDKESYLIQPVNSQLTLKAFGIANETEVSLFNHKEYESFKLHPEIKW